MTAAPYALQQRIASSVPQDPPFPQQSLALHSIGPAHTYFWSLLHASSQGLSLKAFSLHLMQPPIIWPVHNAGGALGRASITAEQQLRISLAWDDPHGGTGYDLYSLIDDNTLSVRSLICVGDGTATYHVIYRRKA